LKKELVNQTATVQQFCFQTLLLLGITCGLNQCQPVFAQSAESLVNSGSFDHVLTPGAASQEQKLPVINLKPEINKVSATSPATKDQQNLEITSATEKSKVTRDETAQPLSPREEAPAIAQNVPPEGDLVPIDLTPVKLPERTSAFSGLDSFKAQALYRLPGRMFFSATTENSLRFEVNTFQTNRHYLSDMIYRVLPNVTVGYALTKRTRVSANYFFFRDQYDLRAGSLSRNIHSVGGRIDHDIPINQKTTLSLGLFPRFLFIDTANSPNIMFNDIIPSVMVSRRVGNTGVIYGSVMGQIRFRDVLSNFQEGDQFYSFGGAWRRGKWNFLVDNTLVTNFGNSNMRGGPNNQVIITTLEAGRRLSSRIPVTAFVRAEPIYNIGANTSPGFAGFNFRIFGGLRTEIAKPPIFPIKLKQG
jgi:hypothetical protein